MIINQFCRNFQDVAVDIIIIIVNATCVTKKSIKMRLAIYYQVIVRDLPGGSSRF